MEAVSSLLMHLLLGGGEGASKGCLGEGAVQEKPQTGVQISLVPSIFKSEPQELGMDEKQCLFCRIARGEIPSKKVYEDSESFAFLDINPRNPGHVLVIPKKHVVTITEASEEDVSSLAKALRRVAIAAQKATNADGLSILQNNGHAAGQIVAHLHFHVIPRFSSEGPPSLEAVLQVKKFDEESMNRIASLISENAKGIGETAKPNTEKTEKESAAEGKKEEISFEF